MLITTDNLLIQQNGLQACIPSNPVLANGSLANGAQLIDWPQSSAAFKPEWRIYARGSSDDKAGVYTIINAYAALAALHIPPGINIKFFFEGEEEAGSTHLAEIFDQHKALLNADIWVISDGPVHQSGRKQVVFGVRGDTHMELTVFGPKRPLHSGHYGNWAPNPAMDMAHLLASMKNSLGEVSIKGFYDDVLPLSEAEKNALSKIPPVEEQLKKRVGHQKSREHWNAQRKPQSTFPQHQWNPKRRSRQTICQCDTHKSNCFHRP